MCVNRGGGGGSGGGSDFPQDLTTMNKKQRGEYLDRIVEHKSFSDLRRDQRIVDAQMRDLYEKYGDKKWPSHAETAAANLALHRDFLTNAIDVMAFDSKANRKIYERATGKSWDKRPASKKPKPGVPFGG